MVSLRQRLSAFLRSNLPELLTPIGAQIQETIRSRGSIRPLLEQLDRSKAPIHAFFLDRLNSPVAAKALTVKVLNLCLARYHFEARTTAVLSRPYGLVADPVNNCNLACPGCVHSPRAKELHVFNWTSGLLSPDRYTALLSAYGPYAIQITLCNYGEPLMNPATPGFVRQAKSFLATTTLSTNMTAKKFDAEAWALSGLDIMTLSIDGATQAVYERYRRKGDIDQIFRNIRSLVEAKRRLGRATPLLSWQFLAFEHNAHEIDAAISMARELGVDEIVIAAPFDVGWDDPAIRAAAVEPRTIQFDVELAGRSLVENWNPSPDAANAAGIAISAAFETGWAAQLAHYREADLNPGGPSTHMCHWLYRNMVMDATGRILPCCAAPRPDADLVFDTLNGVAADPFNSEKYRLARLSFSDKPAYAKARGASALSADPHCANCDWYSDQQSALIDSPAIAKYFRMAGNGIVDAESVRMLS